jgi:hypothetical protein
LYVHLVAMRVARDYASLSQSTEDRGRIDAPEAIASVAATSRRLHRAMVEHLQTGGEIEMSVVLAAHFADGSIVNFGQKSGRLLVESGAVVLAQMDPVVRVMNVDRDLGSVGTADSEDRE